MQNAKLQFKIQNFKTLKKELPEIQRNISLVKYTSFKIGGPAKYFFVAKTEKDLILAVMVAKKINSPFFVLGGGSNLLVADKGYNGLVVKIQNPKSDHSPFPMGWVAQPFNKGCGEIQIKSKIRNPKIYIEAGVPLSLVVSIATKNSLTGLEWAVGIPGTVGGAIFGNAGAFEESLRDTIKEVKVFDAGAGKIENFKNKDCKFGYRDSIFKHKKNLIILSATLQLKKGSKKEIKRKINKYFKYRKETQPLNFLSAGSIFKNLSPSQVLKKFGRARGFPAAKLIESCGLKGKKIGKAQISKIHANFIVNLGGASAKDVRKLINLTKQKVKRKFGIVLEEEIELL